MKIALIMPHGRIHRNSGIFGRALRYAPLTLTTLAALVPKELNPEITIIDEGIEDLDLDRIEADIAGITCITGTAYRAYRISHALQRKGIKTVLGGVHPTLVPDEAEQFADSIVTGFAEYTWPQLLRDFSEGNMRRRYCQGHDFVFANMPEPRRDLLKRKAYITLNTIQATRGCPWRCNFCVVPVTWPGYYHRPIPEVIAEIERLEGNSFLFLDLSPIENPVYIKQLYRELAPLKKRWGGLATMAIARDEEMLRLASRSGCRGLLLGIESVSEETIKRMGKKGLNSPQQYIKEIKKLHDHGIAINGCFVLGLDGDTKDTFERTIEFVDKAAIDLPRFSIPTPFPGTTLYWQLKKENRLLHECWTLYDTQHVVFQPERMSAEELQEGLLWTWKQAYRLPSVIRRIVGSGASWKSLIVPSTSVSANFAYRFLAKYLPEFALVSCENNPDFEIPTVQMQMDAFTPFTREGSLI